MTVTPSGHTVDYATIYTYVVNALSIRAAPRVTPPLHAIFVIGAIVAGRVNPAVITGTGFMFQPTIASNTPGTIVRVYHYSGRLFIFKITLANGKSCKVSYFSK